jgi:predicted CoA-binding protein
MRREKVVGLTDVWRENLVTDDAAIGRIIAETRRIAVLGIKTEAQAGQPAIEIPRYMAEHGYEIIPVPVYYPSVREILGRPVFRTLADAPPPIDMVNVFRRSEDVPPHVDDIIAAAPRFVWMQSGISNAAAAERLARAGIKVVQNHCLMVDHARHKRNFGF